VVQSLASRDVLIQDLDDQPMRLPLVAFVIAAACLLHVYTFAFKADGDWSFFMLGLFAFSLSPYALAAAVGWWFKPAALPLALGFAAAALAGDLYMHYAVFIAPKGSTAALGLLFMPVWNLMLLGPVGALLGWGIARIVRAKAAR